MTQAGKVAEIFSVAGDAFTKLGSLAMQLQMTNERTADGSKWADDEIELLKLAIQRFGNDIEKISNLVKTKSTNQIKSALKQKAIQNLTSISANATQHGSTIKVANQAALVTQSSLQTKNPLPSNSMIVVPAINRSPVKFTTIPRMVGQKSKANDNVVTITGNSMFDLQQHQQKQQQIQIQQQQQQHIQIQQQQQIQMQQQQTQIQQLQQIAPKKIRFESATNLNHLLSAGISGISPNQIIQNNSNPGIPVVASSQGFQMILPQTSTKPSSNVLSILQSGIVQQVSDANTSGTVDVET